MVNFLSFRILSLIIIAASASMAQTVSTALPKQINKSDKFLFYLHGGVVTELGNNAINQSVPEWGPYEYLNILDSLRMRGVNLISENRKPGVADSVYTEKILNQIDTLLKAGVKTKNIMILGASAGWAIALDVSAKLKSKNMKYVIMGGCWPDTHLSYNAVKLYGKFLSIIETSDPHGSCSMIFFTRKELQFSEVKLNTGLSHGFIYKGHKQWIDPVIDWFEKN